MPNNTQVALHEAGRAYRHAAMDYAKIGQRFDSAECTLSTISRQALEAKLRTDRAFFEMAEGSQAVLALKQSIAVYDTAHEAALKERNLAGDAMDTAALVECASKDHCPAALEQDAKLYAQAQAALDELQKGEAKSRRRCDVIALRQAEADYAAKAKTYDELKLASDALKAAAARQERCWNQIRVELFHQFEAVELCRAALRSAARAYASMSLSA